MYWKIYGQVIPKNILEMTETFDGPFLCPDIGDMTVLNDPSFYDSASSLNLVINYCNLTGVVHKDQSGCEND